MAKKTAPADTPTVFDLSLPDPTLAGMVTRRAAEAKKEWDKRFGDLKKLREENRSVSSAENEIKRPRDERYQDVFSDNILFKAKRAILAFITGQLTQPEVTPANSTEVAVQFAADFEKILQRVAENAGGKQKIKLANSDLLDGQRIGVLKWTYNTDKKKLELHYCKPDSIVIGARSGYLEEPDFVQHTQKRTVAKLCQQFPDKEQVIYQECGIDRGVQSQLENEHDMTENWIFIEDEEEVKLAVVFMLNNQILGKMTDPNWKDNDENFIDEHMVPFVFFNMLNDGTGWLDNTSFLEQAMHNQRQYNKRGQNIAENADYAGIGVPVFGKNAIKEETAAQVKFTPTNRILLDTEDVNKGFTTWQAGQLQPFVMEDKLKLETSIYDTYGTNQVQTGGDAQTNTLGEAVLMRNQAEGRQQELIDANDAAMTRFYRIEAQMIYRYFDKEQYFSIVGTDGNFDQVVISQDKLADNFGLEINVKSGTNIPIDRAQKTAQALELAKLGKISVKRLYEEIGMENPTEAFHEYLKEQLLPFSALNDAENANFSRQAQEDLITVIGGGEPEEREDIDEDYVQYLTDWLLTNKYHQLPSAKQKAVSKFIADVIAQAQRKQIKQQTQQPVGNQSTQMPPVRPTSFAGIDRLEPDVKAQILQNMGYQPSALTSLEMAAGLVTAPTERINEAPIAQGQPAPAQPGGVQ